MFRTREEWEGFYNQRDPWGYVDRWLLERRRQEIMRSLFERWGPYERALDLGSGEGVVTQFLAEHARNLVSVEISAQALRRQVERLGAPRRLFLQADAFRMSFRPESFDLILASEVLSYSRDRENIARSWTEWLRPGGILMVVDALLPEYFSYRELVHLVAGVGEVLQVEPLSSKHVLAKLANRKLVPFSEGLYDWAMEWTRRRPEALAKHLCVVAQKGSRGLPPGDPPTVR
jgi:SAM-dependent methyltransferase